MKRFSDCCAVVSAFILYCAFTGCASRYVNSNPLTERSQYPAAITQAKKAKWYLMLHSGVNLYSITAVEIDKAKKQMTVQLDRPDSLHQANASTPDASRVKPGKADPASPPEMHVYMSDSASYTLDEPHTILLDKVARIEKIE